MYTFDEIREFHVLELRIKIHVYLPGFSIKNCAELTHFQSAVVIHEIHVIHHTLTIFVFVFG